jgi:hypothetical protein
MPQTSYSGGRKEERRRWRERLTMMKRLEITKDHCLKERRVSKRKHGVRERKKEDENQR